jgi:hypothetical protein
LKLCAISRKVTGSIPEEIIDLFSIFLILPAALGAGVYSASNRNEYQKEKKIWGAERGQTLEADIFTAVCEPIV